MDDVEDFLKVNDPIKLVPIIVKSNKTIEDLKKVKKLKKSGIIHIKPEPEKYERYCQLIEKTGVSWKNLVEFALDKLCDECDAVEESDDSEPIS